MSSTLLLEKAPMTETRLPSRNTLHLKYRVRCYFDDNPDEELTHAQLREKFSMSKWTAVWVLRELVEEGYMESVHIIRLRSQGIAKEVA